ncbi:rhomboid family intramembrane serine protease [Nannocystis sp.]|uniref:rhomboid family intramembrane serine protease n=1 Tax=Nannocystis sp. TaxID=1962667 RepID=UPI002426A4D3|nr:rhomboid family intramembrane serine protease [Nannocystis sp.]MBK7829811.1 rhomboid family intramembrane serine protease [Nannocystis sp.]MBK9757703.1 rhomboid family intramembrane serine protease [Nannocystis sp.]
MSAPASPSSAESAALSAQCPACSLHALVPVHLRSDRPHHWRQTPQPVAGGMTLDTCPVCFGVWLDAGEIDALGDAEIDPAFLKTLVGQSANRMCPRGHGFMMEHLLPGLLRTPIDRCPRCKGLWLDGYERHALARSSTREGQEDQAVQLARRGLIWAAQLLTHLPIEVENPARGTPWAVYGLCALLVGMYILSVEGVLFAREWAMVAGQVVREPIHAYTLFTHAFFHADWFHLLGNLYFLYVFGDNVEHLFGRRRFLLLFVGGALVGGVLQLLLSRATAAPVIGASGAIAGVTAAYLWIFPRARLLQTIPFIYIQVKIPAWVYLGVWIGFQAVMAFFSDAIQFAWFSHLGGFLHGLVLTPWVLRWRRKQVAAQVRFKSAAAIFGRLPKPRPRPAAPH